MAVQAAVGLHGVDIQFAAQCSPGKNILVVGCIQPVIGDMLDDLGGFLVINQAGGFQDELLRVDAELGKGLRGDSPQNGGHGGPRQTGFLHQLADKVVPHAAKRRILGGLAVAAGFLEAFSLLQLFPRFQPRCLLSIFQVDLHAGHIQFGVQRPNGVVDQFRRVKLNSIKGLVVDPIP